MFYRYEAKNNEGQYEGICSFFNPDHQRRLNRAVSVPKWYENNPDTESRCWFTEEGFRKYHQVIDDIIIEADIKNVRILICDALPNIVCKGKIQCIERVYEGETIIYETYNPDPLPA